MLKAVSGNEYLPMSTGAKQILSIYVCGTRQLSDDDDDDDDDGLGHSHWHCLMNYSCFQIWPYIKTIPKPDKSIHRYIVPI